MKQMADASQAMVAMLFMSSRWTRKSSDLLGWEHALGWEYAGPLPIVSQSEFLRIQLRNINPVYGTSPASDA